MKKLNATQKKIDDAMWYLAAISYHMWGENESIWVDKSKLQLLERSVAQLIGATNRSLAYAMDYAGEMEKTTASWIEDDRIEEWELRIEHTHS